MLSPSISFSFSVWFFFFLKVYLFLASPSFSFYGPFFLFLLCCLSCFFFLLFLLIFSARSNCREILHYYILGKMRPVGAKPVQMLRACACVCMCGCLSVCVSKLFQNARRTARLSGICTNFQRVPSFSVHLKRQEKTDR